MSKFALVKYYYQVYRFYITRRMMSYNQNQMFDTQRKKATFDQYKLSLFIYGGQQPLQDFINRQKLIQNDPILSFDPATIHRSRQDLLNIYAKKLVRYTEILPNSETKATEKMLLFPQQLPLGLHEVMFLPTLRNLCDQQQVQRFLIPAEKYQLLGCYAQTELGHGSDVKGLMTTATFDQSSDSFILNTPDVKAAKWWIGDLGVFATHACVFAQLIIKGKQYGVHAFVVQVRDSQHKPMSGVQVGDIGPKFGFNCKDNGYLIFNNVKVPRRNMLMKFQKVSKDGKYEVVGDQKITYATMLKTRGFIPTAVFYSLSKAVTIIVRYSLFRKQFKDNKGSQMPILDYQIQQEKVFPRLAQAYANLFATRTINEISNAVLEEAKNHIFTRLNQAHVTTSAVKAITTKDGLAGLQILRRAGGGHAFNSYSALPNLQLQIMPTYTFQGDFTILMLQVARYLLKNLNRFQRGSKKPIGQSVQYLKALGGDPFTLDKQQMSELRKPQNLIKAYINNSCYKIKKAGQKLLQGISGGVQMKKTWDEFAGIELVECAVAHSYYWLVNNFYLALQKVDDQPTKAALERIFLLYAVDKIFQNSASFFQTESISTASFKALRELRQVLLTQIRPDVLALVQAFKYSDHTLHSAIGRSDGKAYETLLKWAKDSNDVNSPHVSVHLRQLNKKLLQHHANMTDSRL